MMLGWHSAAALVSRSATSQRPPLGGALQSRIAIWKLLNRVYSIGRGCLGVENGQRQCLSVFPVRQLQAADAGSPFRKIGEEIGVTELTTIIRQKEAWARETVKEWRDGDAFKALERYQEKGRLFIGEDREDAIKRLVLDWRETVLEKGGLLKETLAMAGTNLETRGLNKTIQSEMRAAAQLGDYAIEIDGLEMRLGDRIMVTKNQPLLNLKNGEMGEAIGAEGKTLWVRMDIGFEVEIDTEHFSELTLGYAVGVYKAQGVIVENALVMTGDSMTDREFTKYGHPTLGAYLDVRRFSTFARGWGQPKRRAALGLGAEVRITSVRFGSVLPAEVGGNLSGEVVFETR